VQHPEEFERLITGADEGEEGEEGEGGEGEEGGEGHPPGTILITQADEQAINRVYFK
jgi:hypothetical protein